MAETTAAVKADDTGVRWWEPLVAFVGGNLVAIVLVSGALLVAIMRGLPVADATALLGANFFGIMASVVFSDLVVLGVGWWLVRRRTASPRALYFPQVSLPVLLAAAASGVVLSLLVNGANQLVDAWGWVHFEDTAAERAMVPHGAVQLAISVFAVTLLAPLVEEFVFRGLLLRWLKPFAQVTGAVLISGLVFGLIHGQFHQHPGAQGALMTAELTAIGVVLGVWATRTGSLRASFAMHAAFNLTATILAVLWS